MAAATKITISMHSAHALPPSSFSPWGRHAVFAQAADESGHPVLATLCALAIAAVHPQQLATAALQ